jgi:hypothetical protein
VAVTLHTSIRQRGLLFRSKACDSQAIMRTTVILANA